MTANLLLVSSSKCHPHGYLDHCDEEMRALFTGVRSILFVPFARPGGATHDAYTEIARDRFQRLGIEVTGLHEPADPGAAVRSAEGMFIGGGNTFVLLSELYKRDLVDPIRERLSGGMPYMGTSAGSNVAGLTIGTSNDMPIVHPPSFDAFAAAPFNINPHYPRSPPDPTHMGETREDRIGEFHVFNPQPVVAIREDGMLRVKGENMKLVGEREGFVFEPGHPPRVIRPGEDLSHLLSR